LVKVNFMPSNVLWWLGDCKCNGLFQPVPYYESNPSAAQTKGGGNCKEDMAKATKTSDKAGKKQVQSLNRRLTTAADYIAAGLVMLRITTPHQAVSNFKAAMSRLKVPAPRGRRPEVSDGNLSLANSYDSWLL
jgi:hypothetical protein